MRESTAGAETHYVARSIMFRHRDLKEIERVGYFWHIHEVINRILLNSLEEFFGGKKGWGENIPEPH